jgi:hypothetical protein
LKVRGGKAGTESYDVDGGGQACLREMK